MGTTRTGEAGLDSMLVPHPVLVDAVSKRYGSTVALDAMSWHARTAAITAVLGPNGAGKTTAIGCLEGLVRPDDGAVRVIGVDPWQAPPDHRARVGIMLQDGGLPNTSKPLPLLRHLASLYARPVALDDLVDALGIGQFADTTVRRLSGGQRQRVALAAALVGDPDVVFLDEPSAGLDPHARLDVWALVRRLRDAGTCVVVTTHSFEEAERLADDVVIVGGGRTIVSGSVDEVSHLDGATSLEDVYFSRTAVHRQHGGAA